MLKRHRLFEYSFQYVKKQLREVNVLDSQLVISYFWDFIIFLSSWTFFSTNMKVRKHKQRWLDGIISIIRVGQIFLPACVRLSCGWSNLFFEIWLLRNTRSVVDYSDRVSDVYAAIKDGKWKWVGLSCDVDTFLDTPRNILQ